MYKWYGRVGVITGASSPVGIELCKELAEAGMTVCALARKKGTERLHQIKTTLFGVKGKLLPFECDITDESQVKAVFRYIGDKYEGIDLLINNANVMTKGLILDDNNYDELMHIMETNILSLCIVTREAVKLMKMRPLERKDVGHIININSIFGHKVTATVPGSKPMNGMYPASKYAATAITECVRQELLFLNETVKITAVSPGLIESDIVKENANDELVNIMPALQAKDVAAAVIYAISVKNNVQIHEIVIKPVGEFL